MIMKKIITYFLLFNFLIGYSFDICAETLTDIEMENKSLQTEIDSIKAKIATLENNPSDDPACDSLQSEFATIKSESKEADEVYATGTETIKSLDKQIESLEKREKELDVKIKKHKNAQMATGILGGVFGAGAIGLGLWSHFEKNKIASGEYTDPKCVSTIFNKEKERIYASFDRESGFGARTNDLIADVGANCASCCPGKVNECEKESDALLSDLDKKLKELKKPTDDYSWESICDGMMKSNLYANLQDVLNAVNGRNGLKNEDLNKCVEYVRSNYGDIAVEKTTKTYNVQNNNNDFLREKCMEDFCNSKSLSLDNNGKCINKCNNTNFQSHISDEVLCKEAIYKYGKRIDDLSVACSFINDMELKTVEEKDRCFKRVIDHNIVDINFDDIVGVMPMDKLQNCSRKCECSYFGPINQNMNNISLAIDECKKQCNERFKIPEKKEEVPSYNQSPTVHESNNSSIPTEEELFNLAKQACEKNPFEFLTKYHVDKTKTGEPIGLRRGLNQQCKSNPTECKNFLEKVISFKGTCYYFDGGAEKHFNVMQRNDLQNEVLLKEPSGNGSIIRSVKRNRVAGQYLTEIYNRNNENSGINEAECLNRFCQYLNVKERSCRTHRPDNLCQISS